MLLKLRWHHHISSLKLKINSANYALAQVKYQIPLFARQAIYDSLCKSHLNFSNIIYGSAKLALINGLESAQKKCIRNLMGKKYNCHADPIFLSLGQLKVTDLINSNRAILVKKLKLNYLPNSLEPIFKYKSTDEMGSRDKSSLKITDGKKYIINNFPLKQICRTWNAL